MEVFLYTGHSGIITNKTKQKRLLKQLTVKIQMCCLAMCYLVV